MNAAKPCHKSTQKGPRRTQRHCCTKTWSPWPTKTVQYQYKWVQRKKKWGNWTWITCFAGQKDEGLSCLSQKTNTKGWERIQLVQIHPGKAEIPAAKQGDGGDIEARWQHRYRKSWQELPVNTGRGEMGINTAELKGQETKLLLNTYKVLTHSSASRNSKANNWG